MQDYSVCWVFFIEQGLYWSELIVSCLTLFNLVSCHVGSQSQMTLVMITKNTNQNTISRQFSFDLHSFL